MLKGFQVFKAPELSVGATLQLLGISRSAALLYFVWSIPPEEFCPHVVRYSLCRKAFHPGGQHAGIPAVCHDAEDLFFSSASSFSCLFCFQFRFVMTFLLWETALTFRYICFHVIEALASVVFTLLVDRMPSEVGAYPILDFSNLLIGFVIAKLHVGSWHTARADYPALIIVCITVCKTGLWSSHCFAESERWWALQESGHPVPKYPLGWRHGLPLLSGSLSSSCAMPETACLCPSASGGLLVSVGILQDRNVVGTCSGEMNSRRDTKGRFFKRK